MRKYNIPGISFLTEGSVVVKTDGGPWAEHNMPCPVCKEKKAIMNLDGWVFHPCSECDDKGWSLKQKKPWSIWKFWR